jgi:hypothetical protein
LVVVVAVVVVGVAVVVVGVAVGSRTSGVVEASLWSDRAVANADDNLNTSLGPTHFT